MPKKAFSFLISFLFLFHYSFSQKTPIYTDPESDYKKGVEMFEQQKFGAAQKKFASIVEKLSAKEDKSLNVLINASYYYALCAKVLNHPDAEKLFLDLLNNYGETPATRRAYYQLGNIYYEQKKFGPALSWYKKVDAYDLSIDETYDFKFQIGYCYFYKQQFDKAKGYFADIKTVKDKYYYPANYYYGYICYAEKNYDEAISSFNLIKESQLYAPIVPYYITQIYFMKGGYDDVLLYAVPLLNRADLKYTNEIRQLVGKSYFNTGEYKEAYPYLKEFYDKAPQSTKTDIYQIAFCEYKTGDYAHAIGHFLQLSTLQDSIGQNSQYLLADCYLKIKDKTSARNAFLNASKTDFDKKIKEVSTYNYAKLSYELGYQDVAISSLQNFINNFPSSPDVMEAKEYLTELFLNTNNYRDALAIIKTIDNKSPRLKAAYQKVAFNRAIQVLNDKNIDDADKLFDESLLNPIDKTLEADCYYWKGEIAFDQKKYPDASANYLKYIDLARGAGASGSGASTVKANYGLAYANFKESKYPSAISYFNTAKSELSSSDLNKDVRNKLASDIYLRSGDCNFILRNYEDAQKDYQQVITSNAGGVDYALYQKGIILGLQGKNADKIATLQLIDRNYPLSMYQDDGLFAIGDTYLTEGDNDNAILTFNRLIHDYPNSSYVRKAHLKLGLIYANTNKYENALDEYKIVAANNPKTPDAKEALNGIRQVFISKGDASGYLPFINNIPGASNFATGQDSVVYLAAEQNFMNEKYDNALQGFTDYLNSYPNGGFAMQAHYYRAECLYQNKDYTHALEDYEWVADKPSGLYTEKSVLRAAQISYANNEYEKAYKYYKQVSEIADYRSNYLEAYQGMLYSAYKLNHPDDVKSAATKVLGSDLAKSADFAEAHYYLAKTAMDAKDYPTAYNEFKTVTQLTTAEISAEAMYNMALIKFNQKDLKEAEAQARKISELKPTYNYWIAKSYILLSDIFAAQNDLFNAEASLKIVVDNYKGSDDILPTATEKLKAVTEKENAASKLMQDSVQHSFRMDTLENGKLTPPDTLTKHK